jgi:hypothetical protein
MNTPITLILLYFIMPLWLLVGFADYLCHRATRIESTAGAPESFLHLLMFAEVGVALLAGLFLEVNAGVIALMIAAFFAHEATALWDVSYAVKARWVSPFEQHIHSFLELIPLMAIVCVVALHWDQFLALFGRGSEPAQFTFRLKPEPQRLSPAYLVSLFTGIVLFEVLPYLEELVRGLRTRGLRASRGAT